MKILLVNKFLFPKGGDAISTLSSGDLLSKKGHKVFYWGMEHPKNRAFPYKEYFVSYVDYNRPSGPFQQLKDALNILYSLEAKNKMDALLKIIKPDIVHLHNFAHQLSPSILDAIEKHNTPAVMTMHDYKLTCPAYSLQSNGLICGKCSGGRFYNVMLNRCTKGSLAKSVVNMLEMYLHHEILHIYEKVDLFISPSRFLMEKTKEMGFKGDIACLPNFVNLKDYPQPSYEWNEPAIVYFGRLSPEKGLMTLCEVVKGLDITLYIIGDGPQKKALTEKVDLEGIKNIKFWGHQPQDKLIELVSKTMFAVMPSEWYENNPRSVIEAFAMGKPVVGSRIGGIPELVRDGETGVSFEPGNADDLREKIQTLLNDRERIVEMGKNARKFVETEFNQEKHYGGLMAIYKKAMVRRTDRR